MKIGILTFHRAYNCGAMLQAWALQTVLERRGHEVVFPDCNDVGEWLKLRLDGRGGKFLSVLRWFKWNLKFRGLPLIRRISFGRFLNGCLKHWKLTEKEWSELDLIVVGSDQVWNEKCAEARNASIFLGEGFNSSAPVVGYGISVGDKALDERTKARLFNVGKTRFAKLSWRERSLKDSLGLPGPVVCDPTLLLTREDYRAVEYKSRLVKGPYMFVYAVSDSKEVIAKARKVAAAMNLKCIVADGYRDDFLRTREQNVWNLSPDRFLAYLRDADVVLVSSFHGCVFSVIYGKPFVCLYGMTTKSNESPGRQQGLMRSIGLLDRRMPVESPISAIIDKLRYPCDADAELNTLRKPSCEYIEEMLAVS